jgi:hypothetical protein
MFKKSLLVLFSLSLLNTTYSQEEDTFSGQGDIAFEYKKYQSDNDETNIDQSISMASRVEIRYEDMGMNNVFRFFSRVDREDKDRANFVIEDAYASYVWGANDDFKLLGGFKVFNWSQTEAFHPADVINSRNLDSELENLEKIGELTLEFESKVADGTLNFYFWPRVEDPIYPGDKSRAGSGIAFARPVFVDGIDKTTNNRYQTQYGLRFNQTFGDADVSFHYLNHFDRSQPQFGLDSNSSLAPHYYRVTQLGGSLLYSWDAFIFKMEAANRTFERDVAAQAIDTSTLTIIESLPIDHSEVAGGLEYAMSFYSGEELTLIFEAQSIFGTTSTQRQSMSVFQHDVFLGARYVLNDAMGTEFFTSFIYDLERSGESIANINMTRRLTDEWKMKGGYRHYSTAKDGTTGLEPLKGDSYFYFNFSRYF